VGQASCLSLNDGQDARLTRNPDKTRILVFPPERNKF
jgi:hypothetical protein